MKCCGQERNGKFCSECGLELTDALDLHQFLQDKAAHYSARAAKEGNVKLERIAAQWADWHARVAAWIERDKQVD